MGLTSGGNHLRKYAKLNRHLVEPIVMFRIHLFITIVPVVIEKYATLITMEINMTRASERKIEIIRSILPFGNTSFQLKPSILNSRISIIVPDST